MGKITKILFSGIALGVAAITAYSYKEKYDELKKEQEPSEDGERSYTSIDKEAAVQAAKETFDKVKHQTQRAYGVAKESAKAVYGNVIDEYGEDIEAGKVFASEKADEFKEYASDKMDEIKEKAGDAYEDLRERAFIKFEDVKGQAGEKFNSVKERVTDKVSELRSENPEFFEKFDKVKKTTEDVCDIAKETAESIFDSSDSAPSTESEDSIQVTSDEAPLDSDEQESIENLAEKADDFVQKI